MELATQLPVVCPITSGGEFAKRIGFAVAITGIKTTGVVRCDQPRVINMSARNARLIDTMPADIMDDVLAKLRPIFE
jgi:mRNA interferase ChpB